MRCVNARKQMKKLIAGLVEGHVEIGQSKFSKRKFLENWV